MMHYVYNHTIFILFNYKYQKKFIVKIEKNVMILNKKKLKNENIYSI